MNLFLVLGAMPPKCRLVLLVIEADYKNAPVSKKQSSNKSWNGSVKRSSL